MTAVYEQEVIQREGLAGKPAAPKGDASRVGWHRSGFAHLGDSISNGRLRRSGEPGDLVGGGRG